MAQEKAQPISKQLEVSFKEIDALYDMTAGTALVGAENGKVEVLEQIGGDWYDLHGAQKSPYAVGTTQYVPTQVPGIRFGISSPFRWCWRTFVREHSRAVAKDKYVYVFRSDGRGGAPAKLLHVLHFAEPGRFHDVPAEKAVDAPPASRLLKEKLLLDANSGDVSFSFFFHLAAYKIPAQALGALAEEIPPCGVRLRDDAFTDVYEAGKSPDTAEPLVLHRSAPVHGPFLVHLTDPFKEALRRRKVYLDAEENWIQHHEHLANDPEYAFALRLQRFAQGARHYDLVCERLETYLAPKYRRALVFQLLMESAGNDLVRWIGDDQRRESGRLFNLHDAGKSFGYSVFWRDPSGQDAVEWSGSDPFKPQGPQSKPGVPSEPSGRSFSRAVRDYHRASDEIVAAVVEIVAAIHERLGQSQNGRSFLEENFARGMKEAEGETKAGAEFLFDSVRKTTEAVPDALGLILAEYAQLWVKRRALKSVPEWLRQVHGIEVKSVKPGSALHGLEKIARREPKKARKGTLGEIEIDRPASRSVRLTQRGFGLLKYGLDMVNLAEAGRKLWEVVDSGDAGTWEFLKAGSAIIDAAVSGIEVVHITRGVVVPSLGEIRPIGLTSLALLSSAIDVALAGHDFHIAKTGGERLGAALRELGAVLTFAGTAAGGEKPPALAALVIGCFLQAAGSGILSAASDVETFLRNSKYGRGAKGLFETPADAASDLGKGVDDFWYPGGKKLSALRNSLADQNFAMNQFLYNFKPELHFKKLGSVVFPAVIALCLKIDNPWCLSVLSTWAIELDIHPDWAQAPEHYSFAPRTNADSTRLDHGTLTQQLPINVKEFRLHDLPHTVTSRISVTGWVELDVFGNGRTRIRRSVEESFRVWW